MRLLIISDIHSSRKVPAKAAALARDSNVDAIIVAGDIFDHDADRAVDMLREIASAGREVLFVPGNMDEPRLADIEARGKIIALHGRCEYLGEIAFLGLGGAVHGPFTTPFEYGEDQASTKLELAANMYRGGDLVLVSHCPPRDTKVDQVPSSTHAGSLAVRRFVEKMKPILVVSGHIHESRGLDRLGDTWLLNPGPARQGYYALADLRKPMKIEMKSATI